MTVTIRFGHKCLKNENKVMNPVKSVRWPGMEAKPYGHPGSGSEPEHPNCSSSPCLSPLPLVLLPPAPPHFPALHILALLLLRFHLPLLHSPCLNDSSRLCTTEALWPVWPVSVWASAVRLSLGNEILWFSYPICSPCGSKSGDCVWVGAGSFNPA